MEVCNDNLMRLQMTRIPYPQPQKKVDNRKQPFQRATDPMFSFYYCHFYFIFRRLRFKLQEFF